MPAYWLPIREALAQESRTKNFISWDRLREICHENQLTQEADIETMAGIFHRLGVFTYYAEDEWLEDRVFLNSNWLCSTVYRLLDNRNVKDEYKGRLTKEQFREIWQENELFKETAKLIRLLERFGLVYQAENQYIIPMLLPESPAVFIADQRSENALYFVYRFDNYMPKGLLPRLMVGLHHHIKDHTLVWRYGFGVAYGKAQAEIREESENNGGKRNEIWIQLIGKNENRAYLLTVIRSFFEEKILKADFPNMKYEKRVACACVVCEKEKVENKAWYDYDKLKKRKENPSPKAQNVQCEESLETLSVSFLLGLVEKPQNFEKTQKEAIFEAIEEADWAKAFELADKLLEMKNTKSPKYAKLKKKFILGKPDEDFADQIIVFVRNL